MQLRGHQGHTQPADAIIAGCMVHIICAEWAGVAFSSEAHVEPVISSRGILSTNDLRAAFKRLRTTPIPYAPRARLVCVKQTHNFGGGTVWSLEELRAVSSLAQTEDLAVHMDGARLLNAVTATGVSAADFGSTADSVSRRASRPLAASTHSITTWIGWKMIMPMRGLAEGLGRIDGMHVRTAAPETNIVFFDPSIKSEFAHPIAGNLFGTCFISLLLLPIILAPLSLVVARAMWVIGLIGMTAFAWFIDDRWMSQRQKAVPPTPAWIIPVVGMLDIPLAMPALGLESMHGVMVFGLAVGLFFTVPLFTLDLLAPAV